MSRYASRLHTLWSLYWRWFRASRGAGWSTRRALWMAARMTAAMMAAAAISRKDNDDDPCTS